jgi:hypothetical protein
MQNIFQVPEIEPDPPIFYGNIVIDDIGYSTEGLDLKGNQCPAAVEEQDREDETYLEAFERLVKSILTHT